MEISRYTTVVDEFGDPLKDAHLLAGQYIGTVTNANGFAELTANPDVVVRISYVGKVPKFYKLKDLPNKVTLEIEAMEEVVITAKKENKTPKYLIPAIGAGLLLIALMSFGEEPKTVTL